jgi:hypothetical protein
MIFTSVNIPIEPSTRHAARKCQTSHSNRTIFITGQLAPQNSASAASSQRPLTGIVRCGRPGDEGGAGVALIELIAMRNVAAGPEA